MPSYYVPTGGLLLYAAGPMGGLVEWVAHVPAMQSAGSASAAATAAAAAATAAAAAAGNAQPEEDEEEVDLSKDLDVDTDEVTADQLAKIWRPCWFSRWCCVCLIPCVGAAGPEAEAEPEPQEVVVPRITIHRIMRIPSRPSIWSTAHNRGSHINFTSHSISTNRTVDSLIQALALGSHVAIVYERGNGRWTKGAVLSRGDERTLQEVGLERSGQSNGVVWIAAA